MKKTLLMLAVALINFCSYAQTNIFPSSGNVGIGTSSPNLSLDIRGDVGNGLNLGSHNPGNRGVTGFVRGVAGTFEQAGMYITTEALNGGNGGFISFKTWGMNVSAFREVMRINEYGNVGIGTTTPSRSLHVAYTPPLTANAENPIALFSDNAAPTGSLVLSAFTTGSTVSNMGLRSSNNLPLWLGTSNSASAIAIINSGNVGIGTTSPDSKLTVNGTVHSKEVKVDLSIPAPDYVFKPEYKLSTLSEVKAYVDKYHHLPEIPSATQMAKDGIKLGDMNMSLLKKVEELTLYAIEKEKQFTDQQMQLQTQRKQLADQEARIKRLEQALLKN